MLKTKSQRFSFTIARSNNLDQIAAAIALEVRVFKEGGLAELDDYAKYDIQSTFFTASSEANECVGVARVIEGGPTLPPVFAHGVDITEDRTYWVDQAESGNLVEFGTAAIDSEYRRQPVFYNLIRHVYRFINDRGIRYCAMITEPERAAAMERLYLLPSIRIGPNQHYMGEAQTTAPFVFDFDHLNALWRTNYPSHYKWFLEDPLDLYRSGPVRAASPIVA